MAERHIALDLPCGVFYDLSNLVLDLNGTLTVDGRMIEGVPDRLKQLTQILNVHILTADTNQTLDRIAPELTGHMDITLHALESGRGDIQKLAYIERLGREKTVAIGNGCNDALMLREAAFGICVIGPEGASTKAIQASRVVFLNILDALDIFLKPHRMIATMRK
ncbi:HAD family hydrolase [Dissulfurirhabdus thermomarina]|uniref:HAD family hydrolase n=1 Tax=Dissulfurirhabdus thermomarina TaxID=1765737 RepID=A0A6N9TQC0_DISTH|nr:HAD family hydrolase [Dissulfurirhabdus thermomarina]NDY42650.1 HAD family hydrolase [Dissulfurirhabdus thermomarina]NMX23102.1 HAD family hydrolase [Dissulfurirhabdus thermomarina]